MDHIKQDFLSWAGTYASAMEEIGCNIQFNLQL